MRVLRSYFMGLALAPVFLIITAMLSPTKAYADEVEDTVHIAKVCTQLLPEQEQLWLSFNDGLEEELLRFLISKNEYGDARAVLYENLDTLLTIVPKDISLADYLRLSYVQCVLIIDKVYDEGEAPLPGVVSNKEDREA